MFGDEVHRPMSALRREGRVGLTNASLIERPTIICTSSPALVSRAATVASRAAIAKNGHSIGDAQDLVQTMGDIDDSDVAGAQSPKRLEQAFDIGLGKRRSRLVENEDVRLDRQRPADRNERPLGGRQGRDRGVGIEIAAHERERFGGGASHSRPRNEAGPRSRIAGLNRDVLCDRHPLDQPQILMDEGDRQRIRPRMGRPSSIEDVSGVGLVDPGQHFDQRRFARAVLSQ